MAFDNQPAVAVGKKALQTLRKPNLNWMYFDIWVNWSFTTQDVATGSRRIKFWERRNSKIVYDVCVRSQMNPFHQIVYTQFRENLLLHSFPSAATAAHSCVQTMELNFMIFLDRFSESFYTCTHMLMLYGGCWNCSCKMCVATGVLAVCVTDGSALMNLTQVYSNTFFVSKPLNISDSKVLRVENVSFGIFLDVFLSFVQKILFAFRNDMIWILNVKLFKRCHNFDQQRNRAQKVNRIECEVIARTEVCKGHKAIKVLSDKKTKPIFPPNKLCLLYFVRFFLCTCVRVFTSKVCIAFHPAQWIFYIPFSSFLPRTHTAFMNVHPVCAYSCRLKV